MAVSFVNVVCVRCGSAFNKLLSEFNRRQRLGRPMYCGAKCAGAAVNEVKKAQEFERNCELCGQAFTASTHSKKVNQRFCSRSCASKGSMSDERRAAQSLGGQQSIGNLLTPEETLRRREAWKYVAIDAALREDNREFQFEYRIGDVIFDLALLDTKVLIEFDGPYHLYQESEDARKDQIAKDAGFTIQRVPTPVTVVIDPKAVRGL